jgi:voltage-gated potassium channel
VEAERLIKYLVPIGLLIVIFGTLGFVVIEKADVLDSLYMTMITITTVGYGEIVPLHASGRIFAMVLMLFGTSFLLLAIGVVTQVALEGRIRKILGRRILDRQIEKIRNHYILCGYGRMGRVIAAELADKKVPLVVVDAAEAMIHEMEEKNILCVHGSSVEEATLLTAGIQRAKTLILSLATDADAVFTILLARELNPKIEIVARAIEQSSIRQLRAAGVTRIVSPYTTVGKSMARAVLHPEVMDLMDIALLDENRAISMEGCLVSEGSELAGKTLREAPIRQKLGLIIIGIKKADGHMLFNPAPEDRIEPGDYLIAMGDLDGLSKLDLWLNPSQKRG